MLIAENIFPSLHLEFKHLLKLINSNISKKVDDIASVLRYTYSEILSFLDQIFLPVHICF